MSEQPAKILNPANKKWVGLLIGVIAGLVFSLLNWGMDALLLAISHGYLFWIQFAIGTTLTIIFTALISMLATIENKGWFTFFSWFFWGAAEIYITFSLPFRRLEALIVRINPLLDGEINLAPPLHPEGRFFVVGIIGVLSCLFISFLFQNTISQIWAGMYIGGAFIAMAVWLAFFILFGVILDDVFHRAQRDAVSTTHQTIQTALQHPEYFDSPRVAADKHISALINQKDWLKRGYSIQVKSYDQLMETFQVLVDYDGYWVTCTESLNVLANCK